MNSNKKVEELEKKIEELSKRSAEFEKKSEELEEKNLMLNKKIDELNEERSTLVSVQNSQNTQRVCCDIPFDPNTESFSFLIFFFKLFHRTSLAIRHVFTHMIIFSLSLVLACVFNTSTMEKFNSQKDQYYQTIQMKQQEGIWSRDSLGGRDLMDDFHQDYKISNGYQMNFSPFSNSSFFSTPDIMKKDSAIISTLSNGSSNGHSLSNDESNSTTLAMKLKQSQGNFFDNSSLSTRPVMKSTVTNGTGTVTSPKIVVKDAVQPLKNHNTRSLYVAGLYKGLAQSEVKKYFEKYGKIINVTVPPVVDNIVDGQKYLFIKFESCESVDKILKQDFHTIKDISVRTKPGKNV